MKPSASTMGYGETGRTPLSGRHRSSAACTRASTRRHAGHRNPGSESRGTVLSKRKERRLAERLSKPAYVNTDACCRNGQASLAYESALLGNRTELVLCPDTTLAEHLALLMAMRDAQGRLGNRVVFRVDSAAILNPIQPDERSVLAEVKRQITQLLKQNDEWKLSLVAKENNWPAHNLAKQPLHDDVIGQKAPGSRATVISDLGGPQWEGQAGAGSALAPPRALRLI